MVFNIQTQEEAINTPTDWNVGNLRSSIKFGSSIKGYPEQPCTNIYFLDPNICPNTVSDRFSVHSLIRSSTDLSNLSNSNNVPIYLDKSIGINALEANFLYSYIDKIFLAYPLERINN